MRFIAGLWLCAAAVAAAQTAETIPFRAILSPEAGAATLLVHTVRDPAGQVVSARADLHLRYSLPGGAAIASLRVQRRDGPVALDAAVAGSVPEGGEHLLRTEAAVADAESLLAEPSAYEVVFTTGAGAIRGPLQRAGMAVALALLDSSQLNARATAAVMAVITRDQAGRATSGHVFFDVSFSSFPPGTLFTGLHIHAGRPGTSGPPLIDAGLQGGARAVETMTGAGRLVYDVEVRRDDPNALRTLADLADNPGNAYLNLHTIAYPDGAVRGQFRTADAVRFPLAGPGALTMNSIRDAHGAVAAALAIFDIHHARARVTALYAGSPEVGRLIDAALEPRDSPGSLFAATLVEGQAAEQFLCSPERFFVTLETTQGVTRTPLSPERTAAPVVAAVIAAVSDPALTTLAPGGLMTVFGRDLLKVPADIRRSFDGNQLPLVVNGTSIAIGSHAAPLLTVTPEYIVAQVPFEVPPGEHVLALRTPNGTSSDFKVRVAGNAPAFYFDAEAGIFTTTAYQSAGRRSRPARRNELIWGFFTGLGNLDIAGSIAPPQTGRIDSRPITYRVTDVELLVDGRPTTATILSSPGFAGLYQVLFPIPRDTSTGAVTVQMKVRGAASNSVPIHVQ